MGAQRNCFGIPDTYFGFTISQGADDQFYATPEGWDRDDGDPCAPTWEELREIIHGAAESNASGNPEWEYVSKRVNAARAAIANAGAA